MREIVRQHQPTGTKKQLPKIFYASQVDICPPKFKIYVNKKANFHFSYWRYLENQIRQHFGFTGTGIEIDIIEKSKKEDWEN